MFWLVKGIKHMTPNQRFYLMLIYVISMALLVTVGGFLYMYALFTGRTEIPETVRSNFINFLGILLVAIGNYIGWRINQIRLEESTKDRHNQIASLESKLGNGLGDQLAQKIVEQLPTVAVDVLPGGQRKLDPPPADPNVIEHAREDA